MKPICVEKINENHWNIVFPAHVDPFYRTRHLDRCKQKLQTFYINKTFNKLCVQINGCHSTDMACLHLLRRGRGAIARAPAASPVMHAFRFRTPLFSVWGFQRHNNVPPFSMSLSDHVNGGLVELVLRPIAIHFQMPVLQTSRRLLHIGFAEYCRATPKGSRPYLLAL